MIFNALWQTVMLPGRGRAVMAVCAGAEEVVGLAPGRVPG